MSRHSDDGYGFEQEAANSGSQLGNSGSQLGSLQTDEPAMQAGQTQTESLVMSNAQPQEPELHLLPTGPQPQTEPEVTVQVQPKEAQDPKTDCGREIAEFKDRAYRLIDESLDPSRPISNVFEDALKGRLDTDELKEEAKDLAKLRVDKFTVEQACGGGKGK